MYNNRDFDYHYLYKVIYWKLSDMEKHIRKHGNHTRYKRDCLIMRYALYHLEYIIDDYKCVENLFNLYEKKFGVCENLMGDKYTELVYSRIFDIWESRRECHKKRFFYTFNKYIEWWWD
jgi:hypothetical protein